LTTLLPISTLAVSRDILFKVVTLQMSLPSLGMENRLIVCG